MCIVVPVAKSIVLIKFSCLPCYLADRQEIIPIALSSVMLGVLIVMVLIVFTVLYLLISRYCIPSILSLNLKRVVILQEIQVQVVNTLLRQPRIGTLMTLKS